MVFCKRCGMTVRGLKKLRTILSATLALVMIFGLLRMNAVNSMAAGNGIPTVSYRVHAQSRGWMEEIGNGTAAGTTGQSKRLEALTIAVNLNGAKASDGSKLSGGIAYRAHVQSHGWMNWVTSEATGEGTASMVNRGLYAGTTGQGKRLEAVEIELTGKLKQEYDILYRVHVQGYGWMNWSKNGMAAGTIGQGRRLEAIEIKLVKKARNVMANISYNVHAQSYGWMDVINVKPGQTADYTIAGTTGQSKRLEAISIALNTSGVSGDITYSTHVQSHGWMDAVSGGTISGTSGQSKRMEAIKINLTGDISAYYDIYYRVHCQTEGWLDWAKNGAPAGTENGGKRMEAIQIALIEKGNPAPGPTAKPYIKYKEISWKDLPGELTIKVNKQMNCITLYKGATPFKSMICSTGAATPLGTYSVKGKWRWHELMGGVYGQYCSHITGDILFHSVPYYSPNIYDLSPSMYNQLGTQASHGCIRLTVADAKWIYDNCPAGTPIIIYNSNDPGPMGKPGAQKLPLSQTWDPTDPAIK